MLTDPRTNEIHTLHVNNSAFEDIKLALKRGHFYTAIALIDANKALNDLVYGTVSITDGKVFLDGHEYTSDVSDAILQAVNNGSDPKALMAFLEKIVKNPSLDARARLFAFMNTIDLPLAPDGDIYAYKVVTAELLDKHSRTISNHIGAVVTMPRDKVTEDPNQTCSAGLHFCSQSYIQHFSSKNDCLVKLKINPMDVVSIPIDYNNAKGRCARYEVVELLSGTPSRSDITTPHRW